MSTNLSSNSILKMKGGVKMIKKFLYSFVTLGMVLGLATPLFVVSADTATPAADVTTRFAGLNRYETGVKVSEHMYPGGASNVALATGEVFPDGLGGGVLAHKKSGPLLLTPSSSLHSATSSEIGDLNPSTAYILGGTGAISTSVESQVGALGPTTDRVFGADRFATSVEAAKEAVGTNPSVAFIATGMDYPDALSASAVAEYFDAALLLVQKDSVPSTVASYLNNASALSTIYVIGGTGVVSNSVKTQLETYASVTRVSGSDRYATSAAVAALISNPDTIIVVSGEGFADALVAGPLAGKYGAPILLTQKGALPSSVNTYIQGESINAGYLVGGTGVISSSTETAIDTAIGGATPPPTSGIDVGLNTNTPGISTVAKGATNVSMTMVDFTAGTDSAKTVTSIKVTKTGVAPDAEISNVKLFEGAAQLGSTQGLSSSSATFSGLSVSIGAGDTKVITIKCTIAAGANASNTVGFGIASTSDVSASDTIKGTFPVNGYQKTIASMTAGTLAWTNGSTPADATPVIGSQQATISVLTFTQSGTSENCYLESLTLTRSGTSTDTDVANIAIYDGASPLGSTVASLSGTKATFNLSTPLKVLAGGSKNITIKADLVASTSVDDDRSGRSLSFGVNAATDWVATGESSGGGVQDGTAAYPINGTNQTIQKGTLTPSVDGTTPASTTYVIGTQDRNFAVIRFTSGARENVKITQIKLTRTGVSADTDLNSIKLWDVTDGGATPVGTTANLSSGTVTLAGLDITVPKGGFKLIKATASVSMGADFTTPSVPKLSIAAATDVTCNGITSGIKITPAAAAAGTNAMTIGEKGTMTVSLSSGSPAAQDVVKGCTGREVAAFQLLAGSGEAINVTAVTLSLQKDIGGGWVNPAAGDITNVRLLHDGSEIGVVANPTTSAPFAPNITVAAGTPEVITVQLDIPTGSSLVDTDKVRARLLAQTTPADMTSTGDSSAKPITEAGDADGAIMTVGVGSLVVGIGSTPSAGNVVKNASDAELATITLTAGTAENVRVTSMTIYEVDNAVLADVANLKLFVFDGTSTTQKGVTMAAFDAAVNGKVIFDLSDDPIIVTAGDTKPITVKGAIPITATSPHVVEITVPNAAPAAVADCLVSTGVTTGASIDETGGSNTNTVNQQIIQDNGTLTVTADATTPNASQVVGGETEVAFATLNLASLYEDITVSRMRVIVNAAGLYTDFPTSGVKAYNASDQLVGSGTLSSITVGTLVQGEGDIIFTQNITVPKNGNTTLVIKGDLNLVGAGSTSKDQPKLGVDAAQQNGNWSASYAGKYNLKADGAQSGVAIYATGGGALYGSNMTVVRTELGAALNSGSPSGTRTRQPNDTIMKFDLSSSATYQSAFRAVSQYPCDAVGTWVANDNTPAAVVVQTEGTNYIEGAGSLLADPAATKILTDFYNVVTATDFSTYKGVSFWIRSDDDGFTAGQVTFDMDNGVDLTSPEASDNLPAYATTNNWQHVVLNFGDATTTRNAVQSFGLTVTAGVAADKVIYLDDVRFFKDKIKLNLSSNTGLYDTTGATGCVVYLKDSGSNTVATSWYSGTTSLGSVTFLPTTQITIGASGNKTYTVVADTSSLITAITKNLSINSNLGSCTNAGAITDGDVYWYDGAITTANGHTYGWVDSSPNPIQTGTMSF